MTRGRHCCQEFHDQRADFTFADMTGFYQQNATISQTRIVYSGIHSVIHSVIHSAIHSVIHSDIHIFCE
jgi:hypothetical protein